MIYAGTKSKVPAKKKPGWKEAAAQEAEWLKKINSMSLFPQSGPKFKGAKVDYRKPASTPVVNTAAPTIVRKQIEGKSVITPGGSTGRMYVDPKVMYKGDEEMAAREAAARQRKFNTAPAYNKGGDVFVTEEHLAEQLKGNKRRS